MVKIFYLVGMDDLKQEKELDSIHRLRNGDIDPYVHGGHHQITEAIKEAEELGL